jgi:hypothetical protein
MAVFYEVRKPGYFMRLDSFYQIAKQNYSPNLKSVFKFEHIYSLNMKNEKIGERFNF